jgi:predicted acetyltransferase
MKGNFQIRTLTEEDRESYKKLMRYAFDTSQNSYANLEGPSDKTPIDWFYGAFNKEILVAGVGYIPYDIRLRSQDFKMYGIGGVATKPEYRNRGIIRKIMIKIFQDMYENHIPTSVLFPFKHLFYERLGYKLVDEFVYYHFKISDIKYRETDYYMKEVERINDDIRSVYDKAILKFDYIAKRPEIDYWRRHYKGNYKFICYNENVPVGYVIINFPKNYGNPEWLKYPDRTIIIQEAFWLDQMAKQTIFNLLWNHRDQREYIAGYFPVNEIIIDHLNTPRIIERRIFDNSLLRIMDVKAILENLRYGIENFSISLKVYDEFCPWNNGIFTIVSKNNSIDVEFNKESNNPVDIEIDITHLAQLIAGYRTVRELLDFSFISLNSEKLILLQQLFPKSNNFFHEFF